MSQARSLEPYNEFNQALEAHVHPPDWVNPEPADRYNLVVIGAGTAGLVTAAGAAGLGAKVALVERELMGGDCLNVGCVPSKGIISAARAAAAVRTAGQFGIQVPAGVEVDFAAVMQRMRRLRAGISHVDSAERFRGLGVDVFLGRGRFSGPDTVDVAGRTLRFKKAVIATGARAAELPIPGWDEAEVLTNETVFSLTELPRRLAVIGGGPIGSEMAQTFARLGSRVTLIEKSRHILSREDEDAALIVQQALAEDGVDLRLNTETTRLARDGEERIVVFRTGSTEEDLRVDHVLVGIGRQPNVDGMDLDNVGIEYDVRSGVQVNDRLRTTNPRVFACGDVCSKFKFTHAADFMARIVIQNALFLGRRRASALQIPWCTYTSPELAHIGWTASQAATEGVAVDTFTLNFDEVDRAILDGADRGFVRVHVRSGSDKIVGATIVADHAGDMVSSLSLAMTNGLGLRAIANSIHPYPTQAEAIRKVADLHGRTRLTPRIKGLFDKWLAWNR